MRAQKTSMVIGIQKIKGFAPKISGKVRTDLKTELKTILVIF